MIYLITGSFLVSILIGTLIVSRLAERYGRLKLMQWCSALTTVGEFFILASGDAVYFMLFLIFFSLFLPGVLLLPIIYFSEITAYNSRKVSLFLMLGLLISGYFPSYFLIFFYFSWRPIVIASLSCGFIGFTFSWLLVESPRYLAVVISRYSKTRVAFERVARENKCIMFEGKLEGEILNEYSETIRKRQSVEVESREMSFFKDNSEIRDMNEMSRIRDLSEMREESNSNREAAVPFEYLGGAANAVDRETDLDRGHKLGYFDLCREENRKEICFLCGIWLIHGSTIYMFSHSGQILPDVYLNVIMLILLGLVGLFLGLLMSYRYRTKRVLIIVCVGTGLILTVQGILVNKNNNDSGIFALGIVSMTCLQYVLNLYSLEIMQTALRCIGIGIMHFFCLIGILIGYFCSGSILEILPIMSGLLFIYPILISKLQETGGLPLRDFSTWSPI